MHRIAAVLLALLLAGCGTAVPTQPADPKVTAQIVQACLDSGLFKLAGGGLSMLVPAAALPVAVISAGIDRVCADPEKFAGDVSTVEWLVKNLSAIVRRQQA